MSYDYKGKVVVITGGTGQVGRVVARAYLEAGAKVIAADRVPPPSSEDNQGIFFQHLDVLSEESVNGFFEEVNRNYGPVYALVSKKAVFRFKLN